MAPYRVHYWVVVFQPRTAATGALDSVPLKFKFTTCCTRLSYLPDGVQSVSPPPCSTPFHWSCLRLGTTPPLRLLRSHLLRCLTRNPSPSNAFVPGSAASAASALSLAPFQSIPVYFHHRLATHAPGRLFAFSHRSRIGGVAINCATVFCLRRIEVGIRTIPASFIAPASDG